MTAPFDPYLQWLDIPQTEQPPNYYRLLGIPLFESDVTVISTAADAQLLNLRQRQRGIYAQEAARLMNEVATARRCLSEAVSKAAYYAGVQSGLQRAQPLAARSVASVVPIEVESPASSGGIPSIATPAGQRPTTRRRMRKRPSALGGVIICVALVAIAVIGLESFARLWERRSLAPSQAVVLPPVADPGDPSLAGKTVIVPKNVVAQRDDGNLVLLVDRAEVDGMVQRSNGAVDWDKELTALRWQFLVSKPGFFVVEANYAADRHAADSETIITVANSVFTFTIRDTGGRDEFTTDTIKTILIKRGGRYQLEIKAQERRSATLMRLKSISLRPIGRE
ncbi:MAG: hypothetical protein WBF93_05565 [Pirellulales bacterium]